MGAKKKVKLEWFGNAGHLIVSHWCRFHLTTKVGKYLVSTVGEYYPERAVREIHAEVHDPKWWAENKHLLGDMFDYAYMNRFGYGEIGADRKYESMVFKAGKPCDRPECMCGLPDIDSSELDFRGYNTAGEAAQGHMELVKKWQNPRKAIRET